MTMKHILSVFAHKHNESLRVTVNLNIITMKITNISKTPYPFYRKQQRTKKKMIINSYIVRNDIEEK